MIRTALTVLAAAVALASCGSSDTDAPDEPAAINAHVDIVLRSPLIEDTLDTETSAGQQCAGAMDYSGIQTGAVVTFRDSKGETVGTVPLPAPEESPNLVVCRWAVTTAVASDSKFFTAEVGGWSSGARQLEGRGVDFVIDTEKEDPSGIGSTAQVDPSWTRQ